MLAALVLLGIAAVPPPGTVETVAPLGAPVSVQEARLAAAEPVGRRFLAAPGNSGPDGGLAFFDLSGGERRYFVPARAEAFRVQARLRLEGDEADVLRVRFASGRAAYIDVRLFEFYLVPFYTFRSGAIVPD
jgi:hypothetical protein